MLAVLGGMCGRDVVRADHQPVIAVPGNPGVPVIIDGQNATGAVVIGDWGLYRPGHMGVTVIRRYPWPRYRRPAAAVRRCRCSRLKVAPRKVTASPAWRHYFPSGTSAPKLGRLESDEKYPPPVPAESFSRSWSAGSSPAPATIGQPPVITAPTVIENRFRPRRRIPRPPRR
jgi:hypothetical protein